MWLRRCLRVLPCVLGLLILPVCTPGEDGRVGTSIQQVLKQLEQVHSFSGVSISPDGEWVAWLSRGSNHENTVYLLQWKKSDAKPQRITAGDREDSDASDISWSPNSTQFVFLSHGDSQQSQIFIAGISSPKAHQLSNLDGHITGLRWARDGRNVTFLYAEHGGGGGPLQAEPAAVGVIGSEIHNQRIALLATTGGEPRQLTAPDLNVYEYDSSPDGKRFVAIAAPGPADNNWWTAKMYLASADTGEMTLLWTPPVDRQIAVPRWSPDNSNIAFLAGLMSDEGFNGGDIFLIPASAGKAENLTKGSKATATGLRWKDKNTLLFTEAIDGHGGLARVEISSGETEQLWKGREALNEDGNYPNLSFAQDGATSAIIRSTWQHPPEICAGPLGEWKPLTAENAGQKPRWGKAESLSWQEDGYRSQGWLLYPENFDPAKQYPMIVSIHGGPSGMRSPGWPSAHFDMSVMASLGYFVFFPNPRGSYGGGEDFTRANIKDFGGGDLRDILAGVDAVIKKVPVDKERIGVTGWSYGGYMTMWAVTQTHRFHAAVAGAGIANWLSYYGENSIDQWMIPFFGASVYDDPAVYAKSSPINFIKQVKTPTLVVVGERDGECPAPQSFEFWHALKAQNVATELVVYPGEGHSLREPKNRLDVVERAATWFNKYLQ